MGFPKLVVPPLKIDDFSSRLRFALHFCSAVVESTVTCQHLKVARKHQKPRSRTAPGQKPMTSVWKNAETKVVLKHVATIWFVPSLGSVANFTEVLMQNAHLLPGLPQHRELFVVPRLGSLQTLGCQLHALVVISCPTASHLMTSLYMGRWHGPPTLTFL